MRFKFQMLFAALSGILLVAGFITAPAQAQGQLNMICSSPQPVCDATIAEFSKQTGINVSFIRLSAGETYAKLRAEARNPKTDVWFSGTNEPHYQAANENLTESYQSPSIENLIAIGQKMSEDTGYRAHAFSIGAIGFIYNKNLLQEKGLSIPRSWADLLKPEYKGEIALSNPNTAGTGYSILVTLVDLMGEDGAFDYLKKLNPNVSSYSKSGSAAAGQTARGEVAIGITFLHDANMMLAQGFPVVLVAPEEGTGYTLAGVSIVKGARNMQAAKTFVDWILSLEGQAVDMASGMNTYPTVKGLPLSQYTVDITKMKLLELDQKFYGSPESRQHLLNRWDKEIGPIVGR